MSNSHICTWVSSFLLLLAAPLYAAPTLIPAGSLITCRVNETISFKTVAVGDPVLCAVGARNPMLAGASLSGVFAEYRDPGQLVGKGWMELDLGELILANAQIVPLAAKVVSVKGYHVDLRGRIRGKGHATRDTIEWFIPVLWPIDLANLPRRGPSPTLKPETRIVVKIMANTVVDLPDQPRAQQVYGSSTAGRDQYGFRERVEPQSYTEPPVYPPSAISTVYTGGYAPPPVYPIFAPRLERWTAWHPRYRRRPVFTPVPRQPTSWRHRGDRAWAPRAVYGHSRARYPQSPYRR